MWFYQQHVNKSILLLRNIKFYIKNEIDFIEKYMQRRKTRNQKIDACNTGLFFSLRALDL